MTGRLAARVFPLGIAFVLGVTAASLLAPRGAVGEGGPADFATVVATSDGAIAHVTTLMDGEAQPRSRDDAVGAGFVYTADGLVVTSRHILQGAKRVFVQLKGHEIQEARIVGVDDATDVALLKVNLAGLRPLVLGDARTLRKGQWVLAAGSPFHLPRSYSVGIVSGLGRSGVGTQLKGYEDFIQTDAASNVGNSGGPLLNASGEVVGMMTAILSRTGRSQGVGLAVPIGAVVDSLRRMQGTAAPRPTMGVVVREQEGRASRPAGLLVTRFLPGAPAQAAGLQVGDLILEVGGIAMRRVADLQRVVWSKPSGTTLPVVFVRNAKRYVLHVRLR